ncbi:MAG: dienelactone hydrolase family protein [Chloroflexi bacterium]|nr:dienelactone hydrolase family protein [Chloroflexota bacterium]
MPYRTDQQEGLVAETVMVTGQNGDPIRAYYARPTASGPVPGVVLIHHAPGWDDWYKEATLRFARRGYAAICPNLYERVGHGTIEDVMVMVRGAGGVPDAQVVADVEASARYLKAAGNSNGKIGVIGTCSGGRHAYLTACQSDQFAAVADLWGGGVVARPEDLNDKRPVSPVDLTPSLNIPLLGIFGNEDRAPTPEQVDQHEAALKQHGQQYEFHRYDGAGHGFFYYDRAAYRQEQAMDGWSKVWAFFEQHLA